MKMNMPSRRGELHDSSSNTGRDKLFYHLQAVPAGSTHGKTSLSSVYYILMLSMISALSSRDLMIDMTSSVLGEQTEELKTILAPQKHTPLSPYREPLRSHPNVPILYWSCWTHVLYLQAYISTRSISNLIYHHKSLFFSDIVKQY